LTSRGIVSFSKITLVRGVGKRTAYYIVDFIALVQDRDRCWAIMNTAVYRARRNGIY